MYPRYTLICWYCLNVAKMGELVGLYSNKHGHEMYTPLPCPRCGVGQYISNSERYVMDVRA